MSSWLKRAGLMLFAIAVTFIVTWLFQPSAEKSALRTILRTIDSSSALRLLEGLPHQMFESDLLKQELATKETIEVHGYRFYEQRLWVPEETEATLRELTGSDRRYTKYKGPKKCGGFHPDYALCWSGGREGGSSTILVCFGCEEAQIFGETMSVLVDLDERTVKPLKELLAKYRKQRPAPKR